VTETQADEETTGEEAFPAGSRVLRVGLEAPGADAERDEGAGGEAEATRAGGEVEAARSEPGGARDDAGQRIDAALIEEALRGQLEAFNELVRRHQDQLYSLVYRLVPDPDQAADAVQEAFFSAFRNLASYRGGSVRGWLGRIAVNAAMDMQRARKRRPWQPYPEFEDDTWQPTSAGSVEPETQAISAAQARALGEALSELPVEQRTCIVLFDVQGYDYGEIARIMGSSLGTVKSRIHRGRLALRQKLERDLELFRG
jgi:RNA polymerase sigma-70 factor (ECF subfamily)